MSTDTEIDLRVLEETFNAPHCESGHVAKGNRTCTHVPVAVITYVCDFPVKKVCISHVIWAGLVMHRLCNGCRRSGTPRRVSECWTINPL